MKPVSSFSSIEGAGKMIFLVKLVYCWTLMLSNSIQSIGLYKHGSGNDIKSKYIFVKYSCIIIEYESQKHQLNTCQSSAYYNLVIDGKQNKYNEKQNKEIVLGFLNCPRIFHSFGDVNITGERLLNLTFLSSHGQKAVKVH